MKIWTLRGYVVIIKKTKSERLSCLLAALETKCTMRVMMCRWVTLELYIICTNVVHNYYNKSEVQY